jgi:hypothetical protein
MIIIIRIRRRRRLVFPRPGADYVTPGKKKSIHGGLSHT